MADENGMKLFWVQLAMLILCFVFTGFRVYVRAVMARSFSADDWIIVLAMLMFVASSCISMRGATAGAMGQIHDHYSSEKFMASLKGIYLCEVLYSPLSLAIRVSVCLFLLRIVTKKAHRWIVYVLLAVVSAASNQMKPDAEGYCIDQGIVYSVAMVHGSVSALSAWVVGLLPVIILWDVRMERRTKVTAIGLLGMSILAGIILVVRMATLTHRDFISKDFFPSTMKTALWTMIEPSVGIIAASVPTLRPLFKKLSSMICPSKETPISMHADSNVRSRPLELKPHWLELTNRDPRDDEEGGCDNDETKPESVAWKEVPMWDTCVERGNDAQSPPPGGVRIHTAIVVTSTPRDPVLQSHQHSPQQGARHIEDDIGSDM